MYRIKIDIDYAYNLANILKRYSQSILELRNSMSGIVSSLDWESRNRAGVDSMISSVQNMGSNLSTILSSLGNFVEGFANKIADVDRSSSESFLSIKDNLWDLKHTSPTVIKNPGDYYFKDENGEDIAGVLYLNKEDGARIPVIKKGFGHAAIIFIKSDGSAIYYSYGAKNQGLIDGAQIFQGKTFPGVLNRRDLSPSQFKHFMQNGVLPFNNDLEQVSGNEYAPDVNGNYYYYTRYISLPVNKKQGQSMFEEAQKIFNKQDLEYNLYKNNCNHVSQQILGSANLSFTPDKGAEVIEPFSIPPYTTSNLAYNARYGLKEFVSKNPEIDKMGTIPNGAYNSGVLQWEVYKGYEKGNFPPDGSNTNSLDLGLTDIADDSAKLK